MTKKKGTATDGKQKLNEQRSCRYGNECRNSKCKFSHPPERVLGTSNDKHRAENNDDGTTAKTNKESNYNKENDVNNFTSDQTSESGAFLHGGGSQRTAQMRLMSDSAQKYFSDRIASLEQQNSNLAGRLDNVHWEHEKELQNIHLLHEKELQIQQENQAAMTQQIEALTFRLKQLQSKHDKQGHKFRELQAEHEALQEDQGNKQKKTQQLHTMNASNAKAIEREQQDNDVPAKASKVTQDERARDVVSCARGVSRVPSDAETRATSQERDANGSTTTVLNDSTPKQSLDKRGNDALHNDTDGREQGADAVDLLVGATKTTESAETSVSSKEPAIDAVKAKSVPLPTSNESNKLESGLIKNTVIQATGAIRQEVIKEARATGGEKITSPIASSIIINGKRPTLGEIAEGLNKTDYMATAEKCAKKVSASGSPPSIFAHEPSDQSNGNSVTKLAEIGRGITSCTNDANNSILTKLEGKTNTKSLGNDSFPAANEASMGVPSSSGSQVSEEKIEDSNNDSRPLIKFLFPKIATDTRPQPASMDDLNLRAVIQEKSGENEIVVHFIATKLATFNHETAKQFMIDANKLLDDETTKLKDRRKRLEVDYRDQRGRISTAIDKIRHDKSKPNFQKKTWAAKRKMEADLKDLNKKILDIEVRRTKLEAELEHKLEEQEKRYIDSNKLARELSHEQVGFLSKRLKMIPDRTPSPIFALIKGDKDAANKGRKYLEMEQKIQVAKATHQHVLREHATTAKPYQQEINEHTATVSHLEEKLFALRRDLQQLEEKEQAEPGWIQSLAMDRDEVEESRKATRIRARLKDGEHVDKAERIRKRLRNEENAEDAPTAEELAWLREEGEKDIFEAERLLRSANFTLKEHNSTEMNLGHKLVSLGEELQALSKLESSIWFQKLNSTNKARTVVVIDKASIRKKLKTDQFEEVCDKMARNEQAEPAERGWMKTVESYLLSSDNKATPSATGKEKAPTTKKMDLTDEEMYEEMVSWLPTASEVALLRKEDEQEIAVVEKHMSETKELIDEHATKVRVLQKRLPILRKQVQEVSSEELLRATRPLIPPLKRSLVELDLPVRRSQDALKSLRLQLCDFLGVAKEIPEDVHFDIDGLRDEHGHSFLLVATLLYDETTTETCCRLGANPNKACRGQITPMNVASYFNMKKLARILARYGGETPTSTDESWLKIRRTPVLGTDERRVDWESILEIANRAAEATAQEEKEVASLLEADEKSRMHILTQAERNARQLTFFESVLTDAVNSDSIRRQILLEKSVYSWFQDTMEDRSLFLEFLTSLLPEQHRRRSVSRRFSCSRRAVVGLPTQMQYELLAVTLRENQVVMLTPFVTNAIEGKFNVGVLLWAVCPDSSASFFKTRVEGCEFLRNKVDTRDMFPGHLPFQLELGKDMHLLDLQSTNIYTSRPATLFTINIDNGELETLEDPSFTPKKRVLDYEDKIDKALFSRSEEQAKDEKKILSATSSGKSTLLSGAAGTGKTALLSKKLISESLQISCLVVTRLSRLLSLVKSCVEKERDTRTIRFITYDDLMSELAYMIKAPKCKKRTFAVFSQVDFGETKGTGEMGAVSFVQEFVNDYLTTAERKRMKALHVEDLTLFSAIRTIKSNSRCLEKLEPLGREAYMQLPENFGLHAKQRSLVYELYERYQDWLSSGNAKWDEADRTLYVLKYGPSVFHQHKFLSWYKRYVTGLAEDTVSEDGRPLQPFYYDKVYIDEAQDFSELDLNLFVRMGKNVKSAFLAADAAQSVEIGLSMRKGTLNDVIHSSIFHRKDVQVKDVLQTIQMKINHRTHEQNLVLSKAVRSLMTRSFSVPGTQEHALITGKLPQVLTINRMEDLYNEGTFRAANMAFICPDEIVEQVRSFFADKIRCDVFGVREAKGLEFDSVAVFNFFGHFDQRKDLGDAWRNSLRWLFSRAGVTTTDSTEKVLGKPLKPCNYLLSHPELQDQMAMLYTALTRSRNRLYIIEIGRDGKSLGEVAFRCFTNSALGLAEKVEFIDEGCKEMTPQQHKARGVLLVTQAFNMSRENKPFSKVQAKFEEARGRFGPDKGNDKQLLDLCTKHMKVVRQKRALLETIRTKFYDHKRGEYDLQGKFIVLLEFERHLLEFFSELDAFVVEELQEVARAVSRMVLASPYEHRFGKICRAIQERI